MSRELRALLQKKEEMRKKALKFIEERNLDEAEKIKAELEEVNREIELLRSLEEDEETRNFESGHQVRVPSPGNGGEERSLEEKYHDVYMKVLRNKNISSEERSVMDQYDNENRSLTEKADEDGGVLVPVDQRTEINEFKRSSDDLAQFVNVEPVNTLSGSRVLEKLSEMTPLQELDENGEIRETDNPKFTTVAYAIKQKFGILPISNTLMKAADKTLKKYVNKWIAKKVKITNNIDILTMLKTLAKKTVANFDDIKKILNVELDPALSVSSIILTNQDGIQKLDTMKDSDGKYILQPDPKNETQLLIKGRVVKVVSNKVLPSVVELVDTNNITKAPMFIGDLKEAITLFEFENYELKSTDVGGKAFTRNTTDMRVIIGTDTKLVDKDAAFYGQLEVAVEEA